MTPHRAERCPICGDPEVTTPGPCLDCRAHPPKWTAATSWGAYSGTLRDLVLVFKHRRRDELAAPLAERIVEAVGLADWPEPDLVVPVPTPPLRLLRRGFNPAARLAVHVARSLGAPLRPVLRRRRGGHQVGRTRRQRQALGPSYFPARTRVSGRILLVDDVLTTGSTARACTQALVGAGAREVYVATLGRTPRSGRMS